METEAVVFREVLEHDNDEVLGQILQVLPHSLQLQDHVVELFLYSYLLHFLDEVLDLERILLLCLEDLRDSEELQDLIRPLILINRMWFNILQTH